VNSSPMPQGEDPRPPEELVALRLRLWLRMLRCTTRVENTLRQRLRERFNLTLPQFDLLAALYRTDQRMTMSELSSYLLVSNGNVTGLVKRLEQFGWVASERLPEDRRTQQVWLTGEGKQQFECFASEHHQWVAELLAGAEGHEEQLTERLQQVRDGLPET
jgi:DNA-binding MarR family transcriptional regulator